MIKVRGILILNDTSGISALDFFWVSVKGTRPDTWYLLCAVSLLAPHLAMNPSQITESLVRLYSSARSVQSALMRYLATLSASKSYAC